MSTDHTPQIQKESYAHATKFTFNPLIFVIMDLHLAKRSKARIRVALQGPAGSGKTYSSLLLGYGLTGDWSKIALVDTESGSGDLYSDLGNYYVLSLSEPFSPDRYIEALKICENAGIECIIIDSASQEWSGKGGCLQLHEEATSAMRVPNSYTAWAMVTPKHSAFIDAILRSKCHVITTIRSKTEYVISERNGKNIPVKLGMAPVQRDGFEYEVTISLDLDDQHLAMSSKDRTNLFSSKPKFQITVETGKLILEWCNAGENVEESIKALIKQCITVDELNDLYRKYPECNKNLYVDFANKKQSIMGATQFLTHNANIGGNGHGIAIS
jgi:hypothetical protein